MKLIYRILTILMFVSCTQLQNITREVDDFNTDWKFNLGDIKNAESFDFEDTDWEKVKIPHDWSINTGYQKNGNTASSTGFVKGGIGWYRKTFKLNATDKKKHIEITFDGIYNNSTVWINGHFLGTRPNGYSTFSYDLTPYLNYNDIPNLISVKVDHSAYADSRWYTGSGIYRKVALIKTNPTHIEQWGVQITTDSIDKHNAYIKVNTLLNDKFSSKKDDLKLHYQIYDPLGAKITSADTKVANKTSNVVITIDSPQLWSLETPNLYTLNVDVYKNDKIIDQVTEKFGIRYFNFDANTGFSLNGKQMKLKGVNLHHDAGALGAAVPKAIWEFRVKKLKGIGVNAIRLSHNPHAVELLEVCDNLGMLVINEAFDEWSIPKGKSKVYVGDNAASKEASKGYPALFDTWAEKDLKDFVKRDFNHPSVIMWSIGNEIEWTYSHYSKTYKDVNGAQEYFKYSPNYDSLTIRTAFDKNLKDTKDPLVTYANRLSQWVKSIDTSRPITCGSVHPSIGMASGYGSAVDVYGFNYRAVEYDAAHKAYPNLKIMGSENWGSYSEWKNCVDRDFVAGIFIWTGFAYLGEAGPWPRKGLNISLFDYAGFKTPRGHFFECLWNETPKVYMVTTPANTSEFSYSDQTGWQFDMQFKEPPLWKNLRLWEWYTTFSKWNYKPNEPIIVQSYTNCEEAELFLNGKSMGKQKRANFSEDNIIKWQIPFEKGKLKIIGYNNGVEVGTYELNSTEKVSKIEISSNKKNMKNSSYDVSIITINLMDANNNLVTDQDMNVTFKIEGVAKNIGVDNGSEMNVQNHKSDSIVTKGGKAVLFLQSTNKEGIINIEAFTKKIRSEMLSIINQD